MTLPDLQATPYDIRDFGAVGDGGTMNTAFIQRAIDTCAERGGGEVVVRAGRYVTGTLFLRSHLTLRIEAGAALLGSTDIADYHPDVHKIVYAGEQYMDRCLIYGRDLENVTLAGEGTIDGRGETSAFPNAGDPEQHRPMLLRLLNCRRVRLRDLTLERPAAWTCAFLYCDDLTARGLTIHSRVNHNGDGLDFDGCTRVRVSDCAFDTSDDSICLQASRQDRPVHGVTISNCVMTSRWAGIRIGMASYGELRDVTVSNCVFHDTADAGLKIQMVEGGRMESMLFQGLVMRGIPRPILMTFNSFRLGVDTPEPPPGPGLMRGFTFADIRAEAAPGPWIEAVAGEPESDGRRSGIVISGAPGFVIEDVTLSNVTLSVPGGVAAGPLPQARSGATAGSGRAGAEIEAFATPELTGVRPEFYELGRTLPASALYARHVAGLTLRDVRITVAEPDARAAIACDAVSDLDCAGVQLDASTAAPCALALRRVARAFIHGCRLLRPVPLFARLEGTECQGVAVMGNHLVGAGQAVGTPDGGSPRDAWESNNVTG